MSAPKISDRLYVSQVDARTDTPGVYKRGETYRVLTRPDGKRKVMRRFATYEEAVAFKGGTPSRAREGHGSSDPFWERVLRRDPCAYCGGVSQAIDHIVPVASDGPNGWHNYTASCTACNRRKSNKPLLIFLAHENGCWEWRSCLADS